MAFLRIPSLPRLNKEQFQESLPHSAQRTSTLGRSTQAALPVASPSSHTEASSILSGEQGWWTDAGEENCAREEERCWPRGLPSVGTRTPGSHREMKRTRKSKWEPSSPPTLSMTCAPRGPQPYPSRTHLNLSLSLPSLRHQTQY